MGDERRRLRLRETFDREAERYQRSRPEYPSAVFEVLEAAGDLRRGSRVLEVGPGTGQATRAMAERGWEVTAVELGAELAAVAKRQLLELENVEVLVGDVEEMDFQGGFDAVVAFTSFHWLTPGTRLRRIADLLESGGLLGVVETHHVRGGTTPFFDEVQDCYLRWDSATVPDQRLPPSSEVGDPSGEFLAGGYFTSECCERAEQELGYTTREYLDLLQTYSGHLALPDDKRDGLLSCVGDLIDGRYGGLIRKRYLYLTRTARKAHPM